MTVVHAETGEIVAECTPEEARVITEAIKATANDAKSKLRMMLAHARDIGAHRALGYTTFDSYGEVEFGLSRATVWNWLAIEDVTRVVTSAGGLDSNALESAISTRDARDLKPHLERVAEAIEEATRDTEPDLKVEAAKAAIEEIRKEIVEEREQEKERAAITKPDLGGGISHPARYSEPLYPLFADLLQTFFAGAPASLLDPFAGTGGIHRLHDHGFKTTGIEIEPEWAALHADTVLGSALELPFPDGAFDAIVTSPTYGNRLADSHNASDPELRRSYTHDLGRKLHDDNSGAMQWGPKYKTFHTQAWEEAIRVLADDGVVLLNIKDHIRASARQHVAGWHVTTLCRMGLSLLEHHDVTTAQLRQGANASLRFNEQVYVFVKDHA